MTLDKIINLLLHKFKSILKLIGVLIDFLAYILGDFKLFKGSVKLSTIF